MTTYSFLSRIFQHVVFSTSTKTSTYSCRLILRSSGWIVKPERRNGLLIIRNIGFEPFIAWASIWGKENMFLQLPSTWRLFEYFDADQKLFDTVVNKIAAWTASVPHFTKYPWLVGGKRDSLASGYPLLGGSGRCSGGTNAEDPK